MRRWMPLLLAAVLSSSGLVSAGVASASVSRAPVAADCGSLTSADLSFDAPLLTGAAPQGGRCFTLPLAAGDVVRLAGVGFNGPSGAPSILDAGGQTVCAAAAEGSTSDCTLPDSGPFTLEVSGPSDAGASGVGFQIQLVQLDHPRGCGALPLTGFGGDVPISGQVTQDGYQAACSVGSVAAGPLAVLVSNPDFAWQLRDADGTLLCSSTDGAACDVPAAGQVTLIDTPRTYESGVQDSQVVVPLASSTGGGCGAIAASWTTAPSTVQDHGSPRVACQTVSTAAATRLLVQTSPPANSDDPDSDEVTSMLVDASGEQVCPTVDPTRLGCDVSGRGPVRVVSWFDQYSRYSALGSYRVAVRDLGTTAGCPALTATDWGVPAPATKDVPCRVLTPAVTSSYRIDGYAGAPLISSDGSVQCQLGDFCHLSAGTAYVAVVPDLETVTALSAHQLDGGGCTTLAASPSSALTGSASINADPCAQLPYPEGAQVLAIGPEYVADNTVYDANGAVVCPSPVEDAQPCTLTGPAPYRVIVQTDGPYALAFDRTDTPSGCETLDAGAYGTTAGSDASFTDTTFARCLVVAAGSTGVGPAFYAFQRTSGSSYAQARFVGPGSSGCDFSRDLTFCRPTDPSQPLVVLLTSPAPGTFRVVERPVGPGVSCPSIPDSALHGGSLTGTLESQVDLDCYTLSAAQGDEYALGADSTGDRAAAAVFDASRLDGTGPCGAGGEELCVFGGAGSYQVVLYQEGGYDGDASSSGYQLSPFRYRTASGFAPECGRQPGGYAGGFGPLTGTLSATHAVVCEVVPQKTEPYLVDLGAQDTLLHLTVVPSAPTSSSDIECYPPIGGGVEFECTGFGAAVGDEGVLLMSRLDMGANTPYVVAAGCTGSDCVPNPLEVLTAPKVTGSTAVGGTLTGSYGAYLPSPDNPVAEGENGYAYQWLQDGTSISGGPTYTSSAPTLKVKPAMIGHRISLRVTAVRPGFAPTAAVSSAVVIPLAAAPRVKVAPKVTGTAKVGRTLKVSHGTWAPSPTAYRYAWYAGSKLLPTTSAKLKLTSALAGKSVKVVVTAVLAQHVNGTYTSKAVKIPRR